MSAALFLHGQPGSARDWDGVLAALPEEVRPIVVDRPGWDGRSRPTDLPGNAGAAIAALDAHGVERAVVIGHSFGGAVAAWLAVHRPDRVAALVLAAPSANTRALYPTDYVLAAPYVGWAIGAALLGGTGTALSLRPIRRALADRLALDERYLRSLARMLARPASWRAFAVEQRALVDELEVLEAQLPRISAPTLIVAGAADRIVPTAAAETLADQIPGAELVMLRRAGHLLPHRHAERLADIVTGAALTAPVRSNS